MRKFGHRSIGICQGDVLMFSDFETDGEMWTGAGTRHVRRHLTFDEPFVEPPVVSVFVTMWDMSNTANGRADVIAEDVTEEGFAIVFRTWEDTKVARVRVGWTAVGPARDDDDWDVA